MDRALLSVVAAVVVAGCATLRPPAGARPSRAAETSIAATASAVPTPGETAKPGGLECRPLNHQPTVTAADISPALAEALSRVDAAPTAVNHRLAGDRYRGLGILDQAHREYGRATALEPSDAQSWENMAQIWRDWGFPNLGLPDAQRAVHHAPGSASAHNTLGTLLQALGQGPAARKEFQLALTIAPGAGYVLNNLCYSWMAEAEADQAVGACRLALDGSPNLVAAHVNLAHAYGLTGNMEAARKTLESGLEPAHAEYQLGLLFMAARRYADAIGAFERAGALDPTVRKPAERRARQAQALAGQATSRGN